MSRNHLHHTLSGFVILLAIIACALPGQTTQPASGPNVMETTIAETTQAFIKQTVQASLVTITPTIVPTETLTPMPKVSSSGTSLVVHEDGSTQFIDHVAGAQIVFPPGWLVVRVGEQEYYAAWEKEETKNPIFLEIFASMQNLDPKIFRMTALDIRPDHIINGNVSYIDLTFGQGETDTLNEIKTNEIENPLPLSKYELLSSDFFETSQGIQALNIEIQWACINSSGQTLTCYRKRVIFKIPSGSITVDLVISLDKKDLTIPEFNQLINDITLFSP